MADFLQIGASPESVRAETASILAIMQVPAALSDAVVKVQALQVLSTLCQVNNTHITGCTFTMTPVLAMATRKPKKKAKR